MFVKDWCARIAALTALFAFGAAAASAQIGVAQGPIDITADRLEVFDAEARAVFTGNVDAAQGGASLRANRVEVFFERNTGSNAAGAWGEIERMNADGDVYYVTAANEVARGDRAIYEIATNTIVMTGQVVLNRGDNVITGSRLRVNLETGESQVSSDTGEVDSSASERVRAVFFPSRGGDAGDDDDGEDDDS